MNPRPISTANTLRSSAGFTMVEAMIGFAILVTAIVVALNAVTGLAGSGKSVDRQNELIAESASVINSLTNDLALSGWAVYDCTSADFASGYPQDRVLRYYPYVMQQAPTDALALARTPALISLGGGLQDTCPTWFQTKGSNWFARLNSLVDPKRFGPLPILPNQLGTTADFAKNYNALSFANAASREKAYRSSFYGRSQELIFLRACVGGWPVRPGTDTTPVLKFPEGDWTSKTKDVGGGVLVKDNHEGLGVLRMSEWQLGDTNPSVAAIPDIRDPTTFYWNRPSAVPALRKIPVAVNLGAMLSPQSDPGNLVQVRWESMLNPSVYTFNMTLADPHPVIEFPTSLAGVARIKAAQLREYAYLLLPSSMGTGRLVRAHTEIASLTPVVTRSPWVGDCIGRGVDPGGRAISLVVDQVLSDNCMRVIFDTYRTVTDGSLSPNQVRVTLYLAIGNLRPTDVAITYVASSTLTMRVLNSSVDNESISTVLGTASPGFAR